MPFRICWRKSMGCAATGFMGWRIRACGEAGKEYNLARGAKGA